MLIAVITKAEESRFIALNPEIGITTQGETYQEAIHNLKEATSFYLDEFPMKIHSHPRPSRPWRSLNSYFTMPPEKPGRGAAWWKNSPVCSE